MCNQRKLGILLSYLAIMVQALTGLIYTPVMLRLLGQSEYGLYTLVSSVVSYLSLLSLGFGSSYIRFYSRYQREGADSEIARLNGMFLSVFLVLSFLCVICGSIMLGNMQVLFGNGLSVNEYSTARFLMRIMIFNLALTFPISVFDCIVIAHEQFIFQKLITLAQNVLNPFLCIPLLLMGYGSAAIVFISTILTVVKGILNIYFCLKKLHSPFTFKGFQWQILKEMWIFTFFIFVNQIVDQVNWSVDKFLIGRFSGTLSVAVYGVAAQLNSMYLNFSIAVSNVFVPKVNKIIGDSCETEELTKLFTKVGRIQFIVLAFALSGYILFGRTFILLWAGDEYADAYITGILLMLPVTIPLIQNLGIEIQRAKNMHQSRTIVYLFIAIINVLISIPLIKALGPIGAAMGTGISLILGNVIFMNWYYNHKIKLNIKYFWIQIAKLIPALVIPVLFGVIVNLTINISNLMQFIAFSSVYLLIYILSMCRWGLNSQEKELLFKPLKHFFHI